MRIGHWATFRNVMRRFPLLYPLSYVLLPPKVALSYIVAHKTSKKLIRTRVENRHDQKQLDYLTQFLKDETATPPDAFLVAQAGHLILDHFESSSVLSAGFYFLTTNSEAMDRLQTELRGTFKSFSDITEDVLQELPWLHAIIEEIIRLHTNVPYGLPRISPGITVDGHYIPKGVRPTLLHLHLTSHIKPRTNRQPDRSLLMRLRHHALPPLLQPPLRIQAPALAPAHPPRIRPHLRHRRPERLQTVQHRLPQLPRPNDGVPRAAHHRGQAVLEVRLGVGE